MNISQELIDKIHNKLVILWAERIPQLATLDEAEKQERIMAKEIIELVLGTDTIVLTIKEVREAREDSKRLPRCEYFLNCGCLGTLCEMNLTIGEDSFCRLCKKLTKFAKEGEDD